MYDPARDSWNASSENNSADEKDSKNVNLKESDESGDTESETPIRIETQNNIQDDASTEEESPKKSEQVESKREHEHEQEHEHEHENENEQPPPDKSSTPSPPRKFKKPSRRTSTSERDKKAQELRNKLDKRNHDEQGSPSSSFNPKRQAVEGIRKHYNERPNTSVQERQQSPIFKLRSFNNLVKSALIKKFSVFNQVVLDIGCGKGGDLQKWRKQKVTGLIGIDIADVSIEQAKERYDNIRHKNFWADFCVGDAFEKTIEEIVHPDAFPVDFVSSQFTLQYSFENEKRARMMLSNVARALKRGCVFIGTIPDSNVLLDHTSKLPPGSKEWGNSIYKIRFENDPPKSKEELDKIYGYKYDFFLEDAVTNVPEYIVPFDAFCSLALEYGLRLIFRKNFLDFFDHELNSHQSYEHTKFLCRILNVYKEDGSPGIEGDQREAVGIYTVFAFEKE